MHLWDLRGTPREPSLLVKLLGWRPGAMMWLARRVFPRDVSEFFGAPDHLLTDYLPDDYQRDTGAAPVEGFVHVEAGWKGRGTLASVDETRWPERPRCPRLAGIVGHADLSLGESADEVLQARAQLARHDLSFDATIYRHQLEELAALAGDFPDTTIVLCHAGTPVAYGGSFGGVGESERERERVADAWRAGMSRLARHPRVRVKISGLVMPVVGWGYHLRPGPPRAPELAEDLEPLVSFLVETFGAERCMFASNFPVDKVSVPWATLYEAFALTVADRSETERAALFSGTARTAYSPSPRTTVPNS